MSKHRDWREDMIEGLRQRIARLESLISKYEKELKIACSK